MVPRVEPGFDWQETIETEGAIVVNRGEKGVGGDTLCVKPQDLDGFTNRVLPFGATVRADDKAPVFLREKGVTTMMKVVPGVWVTSVVEMTEEMLMAARIAQGL